MAPYSDTPGYRFSGYFAAKERWLTMQPDYFEVLPIHPPPQPMESMTSYLTRLAQANGIPNICRLQPIIFPDRKADSLRGMKDLSPRSFDSLLVAALCAEADLLATTFYYLIRKFERPTNSTTVTSFLLGHLAPKLRYCPLCLQTDLPYYILPWRFTILAGCPQHGCLLLDRCSYCDAEIPFLTVSLKMNQCPKCGISLSAGQVAPMDMLQKQQAQKRYRDLVFLLTPTKETELRSFGPRLAYWRKTKRLTAKTIATDLNIQIRTALSLERRISKRQGIKFDHYLAYVDYLELTFEELFNTILTPEEEGYHQFLSPEQRFDRQETRLLNQVQQVVGDFQEEGARLSQEKVSRAMGTHRSSLKNYPKLKAALIQISHERQQEDLLLTQQKEQDLVEKVNWAIKCLQTDGKRVTQMAIAGMVGMHTKGLFHYPKTKAILLEVADNNKRKWRQQTVQALSAKIQDSILELKALGQPVTKRTVAKLIGVSRGFINFYPETRRLFAEDPDWTGLPPKGSKKRGFSQ
jgi:transcriptional regulator with XRE-family HTH domain